VETTPLRGYAGEPTNFTGATWPCEKPSDADLRLETGRLRSR
jgi:adenylylsulfate kinase-like enzyme